jgi:hypothetical protein
VCFILFYNMIFFLNILHIKKNRGLAAKYHLYYSSTFTHTHTLYTATPIMNKFVIDLCVLFFQINNHEQICLFKIYFIQVDSLNIKIRWGLFLAYMFIFRKKSSLNKLNDKNSHFKYKYVLLIIRNPKEPNL